MFRNIHKYRGKRVVMINALMGVLVVLLIPLSGCINQTPEMVNESDTKKIFIDPENSGTENLSSVIDSIRYVPLETSERSLIGYPWSIDVTDNYIITYHQGSEHQIYLFTDKGDYVNHISIPQGDGPGGLYYPKYIHADASEEMLSIIGYRKMNRYSFSGELIEEIELEFSPQAFSMIENDKFAFYMGNSVWDGMEKMNQPITDLNGKIIKKNLPIKNNRIGLSMFTPGTFSQFKELILLQGYPGYTIYQFSGMDLHIRYQLDFGAYSITEEMYEERSVEEIRANSGFEFITKAFEGEYVSPVTNFYEFDDILTFQFNTGNRKKHMVFYSKENDEYNIAHTWINDIDHGISPHFYSRTETELIAVVEPLRLIEKAKNLRESLTDEQLVQYTQKDNNILDLADKIDENDNPILMFAMIKQ